MMQQQPTQYQQPQQQGIPYPSPANAVNSDDQNILRLQIDVEDALIKFEYEVLRGLYLRVDKENFTKDWVPIAPNYKPPCNEIGIREVMGRIRGRAHIVARLTYKEDDECYLDMFHFHMSLAEMFAKRSDDWEMDEETVKPILDAALEIVEDIVFCARKGFTAINLRSQYTESRLDRGAEAQPSSSFMGVKLGGKK